MILFFNFLLDMINPSYISRKEIQKNTKQLDIWNFALGMGIVADSPIRLRTGG